MQEGFKLTSCMFPNVIYLFSEDIVVDYRGRKYAWLVLPKCICYNQRVV